MFNDVGRKIMIWAKVLCWIYIIAGIIAFLLYGFQEDEWGIAFACLGGGFTFVVSAWFLYGFGQMVDDIHSLKQREVWKAYSVNADASSDASRSDYDDLPEL